MTVMALFGLPRLAKEPRLNLQGLGNLGISLAVPLAEAFTEAFLVSKPPTPMVIDCTLSSQSPSEFIVCNVGCLAMQNFSSRQHRSCYKLQS